MTLWKTREAALECLGSSMAAEAQVLEETFEIVDECVHALEDFEKPFPLACGLTLVKARNLALGSYSLALDGLAQEAGALLRPLLETLELLAYLRLEPSRADEFVDERLPKAGEIAKRIDSKFGNVREFLNTHSSHFAPTHHALAHLVDLKDLRFRTQQLSDPTLLRRNLQFIFAVFVWVAIEGVNCVSVNADAVQHGLADRVKELKARGLSLFDAPFGPIS